MNVLLKGFSHRAQYPQPVFTGHVFYLQVPIIVVSFRIIKTVQC